MIKNIVLKTTKMSEIIRIPLDKYNGDGDVFSKDCIITHPKQIPITENFDNEKFICMGDVSVKDNVLVVTIPVDFNIGGNVDERNSNTITKFSLKSVAICSKK